MNLSKKTLILAASAILSVGAAFSQSAAPAEDGKRWHHNRGENRLVNALNLTDAQKQQAQTIREKYRASNEDLRKHMRDLHDKFAAAKQANNTAELDQLKSQREALTAKWRETRQEEMAEFKQILTADQQAKLDELKQSHGRGHKDKAQQ